MGRNETLELDPTAYDRFGNVVETTFTIKSSYTYCVKTKGSSAIVGAVPGSADITVTAANGVSLKVKFTSIKAPTKLTLSASAM